MTENPRTETRVVDEDPVSARRLHKEGRAIAEMFDRVAPRYDLLNHLLSFGIDRSWRKALAQELHGTAGPVLDVCTGTGDVLLTIGAARGDLTCVGVDFSKEMVRRAHAKTAASPYAARLAVAVGDATQLGIADGSMGAAVIAFGIRNVADVDRALGELLRALRPGGRVAILEFSLPRTRGLRGLYLFYFTKILPRIGALLSGDGRAYRYLPASVLRFPEGAAFLEKMRSAGFARLAERRLSFGLATIYAGTRPG